MVSQPPAGSEQTRRGEENLNLSLFFNFVLFMLYMMQAKVRVTEFSHGYCGPGPFVTKSVIGPLQSSVMELQSLLLEARLEASPA